VGTRLRVSWSRGDTEAPPDMKADTTPPSAASGLIVLIVRHADIEIPRAGEDPPITPAGKVRAAELLRIACAA